MTTRSTALGSILLLTTGFAAVSAFAEGLPTSPYAGKPGPPELCALLDDQEVRSQMDGLLFKALIMCDRMDELGEVRQEPAIPLPGAAPEAGGIDAPVSDPTGEGGSSHTQSETSMALNEVTGTICAGYNDSYHYFSTGDGFAGFSRSVDGGATFTDRGALGINSFGDPALVWRRSDGHFYYAALHASGLGIWRSTDDCTTFSFLGMIHSGSGDDKELMAVDNNPTSPFYGRLYVLWTDFNAGGVIRSTYSDNGSSWSSPLTISGGNVQGAWPVIAPNGDVWGSWVRFSGSTITIDVVRSTNGGVSYSPVTSPAASKTQPEDAAATNNCFRSALRGNIRYLPSPQIAIGPDGVLHAVYSYDPDGANTGDVIDVFYRRSTDNGATWQPEVRLNTDSTTTDQFFPTLAVGAGNIVSTGWYDRREDPTNTLIKYYHRMSFDGGVTWQPDEVVSDVATPVYLDPNLATCYHGDYDTHVQTGTHAVLQWADDRNIQSSHNDPDVFADRVAISTDFLLLPAANRIAACAPDSAAVAIGVPQFSGFSEPVTLATGALPAGLTAVFSPNPVMPPGSSDLTLSGTGGVTPGTYDVTLTGTSSPSSIVHDAEISLSVYNAAPGQPDLTAPANGAASQPLRPGFAWTAATQAASYTLEVDDDPGFASPEVVETGLTETTFTPAADLTSNTVYYWRITADNECGTGTPSSVFTFSTLALPGDCGLGTMPLVAFSEGFESGAAGWSSSGTGSTWVLSGARVHGGAFSYYATDVNVTSDQRLISPEVVLPAETPVTLQFWNWQQMEISFSGCWDGGIVEISTDGGSNWTYLPTSVMLTDPYDGPVTGLGNLEGWCGDPQDWLRSVVDLDSYAGQTARFRFRLGTDSSVGREGWYVDDVHVQSCIPSAPDFTLAATPGSALICAGEDADFAVTVGSLVGFANDVTLAASGNPAGTSAGFSVNPVTPPGSSTLTIAGTGSVAAGSYPIAITGTASGSSGHGVNVTLEVITTLAAPSLTAPGNGAGNQPLRPTFVWSAVAGAAGYLLEVDDDPGFASPVISQAGVAGTSFTPSSDLGEGTTYWWRVTTENACGLGPASPASSFTTLTLLPFDDGFESGDTSGWSATMP